MMFWKIIVVGFGLVTLRRIIKGFPSWDVPLSEGRVVRVIHARRDPDMAIDPANDPHRVYGKRFDVIFDADSMSPTDRVAVMPKLAEWAAARPDSSDYGRVRVMAAVRVVDRRLWRKHRHAEWQQFRRLPDGGLELLSQGTWGQVVYPGKQTERSRPND